MNDFPESEKKMHIESWMIDETRINHFKNTYLSASRNYEAGRERMVGYVVKILDNYLLKMNYHCYIRNYQDY